MHKPAINTERAGEHDEHSTKYSSLFRLLQERVMPGRHVSVDVSLYTDWCVAEPRRHLCESQGAGGDFSASTELRGSVTQQVNLIAEERRRATE